MLTPDKNQQTKRGSSSQAAVQWEHNNNIDFQKFYQAGEGEFNEWQEEALDGMGTCLGYINFSS